MGLVGGSGSGKSSLARAILDLVTPSCGSVHIGGKDVCKIDRRERARLVQMVFQDPYHSLSPRRTIRQTLFEALRARSKPLSTADAETEAKSLLETVRLPVETMDRHPHEFSGGQRQRICIARALAPRPRLLVCDEAVSALDVTTQCAITELLRDLADRTGIALLFITHDLHVVEELCKQVAVMDTGRIVEHGTTTNIFNRPRHTKTRELIDAVLRLP